MADWITELKRAVTHIPCAGSLSSNVVIQVSCEMQQQVADAVAVGVRTIPNLIQRERLYEFNDLICPFLVVAAEVARDGCRCVCHRFVLGFALGSSDSSTNTNINAMRTSRKFESRYSPKEGVNRSKDRFPQRPIFRLA